MKLPFVFLRNRFLLTSPNVSFRTKLHSKSTDRLPSVTISCHPIKQVVQRFTHKGRPPLHNWVKQEARRKANMSDSFKIYRPPQQSCACSRVHSKYAHISWWTLQPVFNVSALRAASAGGCGRRLGRRAAVTPRAKTVMATLTYAVEAKCCARFHAGQQQQQHIATTRHHVYQGDNPSQRPEQQQTRRPNASSGLCCRRSLLHPPI